ncbi:MAG: phenylalanine--tRNA ligase subunit alpha [Puniceicoccaceae bacterium]|nr:MAG: phenylalanine--tRNA ligase subunit alpha [Puniceicoccaceae bacterium]
MESDLKTLLEDARTAAAEVSARPAFEAFKARLVGPNGRLTELMKTLGNLPKEERPAAGRAINEAKTALQAVFDETLGRIEAEETAARLGPPIDPSLPVPGLARGALHPLTLVREEICRIFRRIGFSVVEGPEAETEFFCFDALNTPADHPARDLQDTFYFPESVHFGNVSRRDDERYLLRTHTSSVQIRTMLQQQPPVRIIAPGRCFRRDTVDATHSANFHQVEGLYVDRGVTVRDLKAVLDYFFESLLGKGTKTRFRPHFFPYTEPSFEVDFSAAHLSKVGSKWIEIAGCGMVDPTVFEAVGYDPEVYSGFAFGMGIERIAMTLYGVDDIRFFYQNDRRFLEQFSS